jgi:hypothetical protein
MIQALYAEENDGALDVTVSVTLPNGLNVAGVVTLLQYGRFNTGWIQLSFLLVLGRSFQDLFPVLEEILDASRDLAQEHQRGMAEHQRGMAEHQRGMAERCVCCTDFMYLCSCEQ